MSAAPKRGARKVCTNRRKHTDKPARKSAGRPKGTYALISLGCPKNLVDSERMAGLLRPNGYRMVPEPKGADFVVINTCAFLRQARDESLGVIREMVALKQRGLLGGIIVAGCLAEREKAELLTDCPGIDQLVGVFGRDEVATAADRLIGGVTEQRTIFRPAPRVPLPDLDRLRITPPHLAFLKIAEGCNRLCSFCLIPAMRGPYASKPIEQIVAEAEQLAGDGARELVVIAQDTSFYGLDIYGRPRLAELLARLAEIDGLNWIRLMYLYPMHVTEELIDVVGRSGRVLPYLDLPLQHIDDEVLRRMRRHVTRAEVERLLDRLYGRIDRLVLRTTFIVGFPGETDRQFEQLLDFVEQRRFERLGVFAYSDEPGTPSAELDGKLPDDVKQSRRDRLLMAQQAIAFDWNDSQVGRKLDVLIDRDIPGEKNAYVGRSYADAPEVDGAVYVTGANLRPGRICPCEIVATRGYDLIAVCEAAQP